MARSSAGHNLLTQHLDIVSVRADTRLTCASCRNMDARCLTPAREHATLCQLQTLACNGSTTAGSLELHLRSAERSNVICAAADERQLPAVMLQAQLDLEQQCVRRTACCARMRGASRWAASRFKMMLFPPSSSKRMNLSLQPWRLWAGLCTGSKLQQSLRRGPMCRAAQDDQCMVMQWAVHAGE